MLVARNQLLIRFICILLFYLCILLHLLINVSISCLYLTLQIVDIS
jgi:hypothetical protein